MIELFSIAHGGMLVSNDTEALEKMRFWATQSRDPPPIISIARWVSIIG